MGGGKHGEGIGEGRRGSLCRDEGGGGLEEGWVMDEY